LTGAALSAALALLLSGCGYDYLQHSDRVAYSAGDAVAANLEAETINPSKRSMYDTAGLGRNGPVVPSAASGSTSAAPVASPH
jgi:hypothetical protein